MKGFDTVYHEILFNALWDCEVQGVPHRWFTDYITQRKIAWW